MMNLFHIMWGLFHLPPKPHTLAQVFPGIACQGGLGLFQNGQKALQGPGKGAARAVVGAGKITWIATGGADLAQVVFQDASLLCQGVLGASALVFQPGIQIPQAGFYRAQGSEVCRRDGRFEGSPGRIYDHRGKSALWIGIGWQTKTIRSAMSI